ncbi:MAG TPA: DUF2917 domain-containing protein [Ramlibacter sp.]|nr:DUF2917 domain-containing protein [Ramlibacter sp.]
MTAIPFPFQVPAFALRFPLPRPVRARQQGACRLDRHATRWIDAPAIGQRIACTSGELWITHDGEGRDTVVAAGGVHVVDSTRRMGIHALADSRFELIRAPR